MNNICWIVMLLLILPIYLANGSSKVSTETGANFELMSDPFFTQPRAMLQPSDESMPKVGEPIYEQIELLTELIEIKYANAESLAQILARDSEQRMLSEHGALTHDERTNTLIVRDQPHLLEAIREMVRQLDVPVKQVEIESRIVIINEGNIEEIGVRWGISSTHQRFTIGSTLEGFQEPSTTEEGEANGPALDDLLNVNLGSTSPNAASIAFQIAKLGSSTLLDLELSALQAESKAEVISRPRLLTTNKKSAYIEQGTEIPYLEASESGVATVKFRKAVLSLEVTPQITSDNHLILDLLITQDRPGSIVKTGGGESIAIDTQRIQTQVLVENGETVVLGGIVQHATIHSIDKVPFLADLPLVGQLFKRRYENAQKRELVIFVTPTIQSH